MKSPKMRRLRCSGVTSASPSPTMCPNTCLSFCPNTASATSRTITRNFCLCVKGSWFFNLFFIYHLFIYRINILSFHCFFYLSFFSSFFWSRWLVFLIFVSRVVCCGCFLFIFLFVSNWLGKMFTVSFWLWINLFVVIIFYEKLSHFYVLYLNYTRNSSQTWKTWTQTNYN